MRHSERLDDVDDSWIASTDRPWDPPITERGREIAYEAGCRLRAENWGISRIVVSPFLRCVQTAVEVLRALLEVDGQQEGSFGKNNDSVKIKVFHFLLFLGCFIRLHQVSFNFFSSSLSSHKPFPNLPYFSTIFTSWFPVFPPFPLYTSPSLSPLVSSQSFIFPPILPSFYTVSPKSLPSSIPLLYPKSPSMYPPFPLTFYLFVTRDFPFFPPLLTSEFLRFPLTLAWGK